MSAKFHLKKSTNGQFFFSLHAGNGQSILASEMYESKAGALNGIESVKTNGANEARYERLEAKNGSPYFTLKAANGQVIGNSQMYSSASARDQGIEACRANAAAAATDDQTQG